MQLWRAGDARLRVHVDTPGPEMRPRLCINRVHIGLQVAEERGEPRRRSRDAADGHRCPHDLVRRKPPVHAALLRIERVHSAGTGADENPSADDRGLAGGKLRGRKAEGPLHGELRHVRLGQPRTRRRLEARVDDVGSPAIPHRCGEGISERLRRAGLRLWRRLCRAGYNGAWQEKHAERADQCDRDPSVRHDVHTRSAPTADTPIYGDPP